MKKRLAVIILAALMCFLCTGCGNSSDPGDSEPRRKDIITTEDKGEKKDREEKKEEKEEKQEGEADSNADMPGDTAPQFDEYDIRDAITPFKEGRAWVRYFGNDQNCTALIDTEGNQLFCVDQNIGYNNLSSLENGAAYVKTRDEIVIIDRDGNETARLSNTDEKTYEVLASYSGYFFIREKVKNFSENSEVIYIIDRKGNKVTEDITENNLNIEKLCEGVYFCGGLDISTQNDKNAIYRYHVFNFLKGDYFDAEVNVPREYSYDNFQITPNNLKDSDGYAKVYYRSRSGGDFYDYLSIDDYSSKESLEAALSDIVGINGRGSTHGMTSNKLNSREGLYVEWGRNIFYSKEYKPNEYVIFDVSDNEVARGELPEGVTIQKILPFSGGYAIVFMWGKDGNNYATAIDKTGTLQYEPVRFDFYYENVDHVKGYCVFYDGILTPSGKVLKWSDDLSEIPADISLMNEGLVNGDIISEGYVIEPSTGKIRSLDGSVVIDKVKVSK